MAKPGLMIEMLGKGPGEDEESEDDSDLEDPEDSAPPQDPEESIRVIERQLEELRRAYAEL